MARPLTFSTGRLKTRIKAVGHRRSIAMYFHIFAAEVTVILFGKNYE